MALLALLQHIRHAKQVDVGEATMSQQSFSGTVIVHGYESSISINEEHALNLPEMNVLAHVVELEFPARHRVQEARCVSRCDVGQV